MDQTKMLIWNDPSTNKNKFYEVTLAGGSVSVRYGRVLKHQVEQARTALARVGVSTSGIVLNVVPPRSDLTGTYDYDYIAPPAGVAAH